MIEHLCLTYPQIRQLPEFFIRDHAAGCGLTAQADSFIDIPCIKSPFLYHRAESFCHVSGFYKPCPSLRTKLIQREHGRTQPEGPELLILFAFRKFPDQRHLQRLQVVRADLIHFLKKRSGLLCILLVFTMIQRLISHMVLDPRYLPAGRDAAQKQGEFLPIHRPGRRIFRHLIQLLAELHDFFCNMFHISVFFLPAESLPVDLLHRKFFQLMRFRMILRHPKRQDRLQLQMFRIFQKLPQIFLCAPPVGSLPAPSLNPAASHAQTVCRQMHVRHNDGAVLRPYIRLLCISQHNNCAVGSLKHFGTHGSGACHFLQQLLLPDHDQLPGPDCPP